MPLKRVSIVIFLIAFGVRFSATLRHRPQPDNVYEPTKVALAVARHGSFADPFMIPTGPTAHIAPAFPLVLSVVYKFFGDGEAAEIAKRFLNCFVSSLQYALLPWVTRVLGLNAPVGLAAAFFGALLPLQRYAEVASSWESSWTAVLSIILVGVWRKQLGRATRDTRLAIRAGALWGLALLINPAVASVYVGCVGSLRRQWRSALVSVFVTVLCLSPWALRNKRQLGSWVWLTDNFGLELSISNSDGSASRLDANLRSDYLKRFHPHESYAEALRVRELGEVEYNRRRFVQALAWIASHFSRFCRLTGERVVYFWFPWVPSPANRLFLVVLTLLALAGLHHTFQIEPITAKIVLVIWVLYPLVFYIVQFDRRYRHPIEWTLLLMTAQAVVAFTQRKRPDHRSREAANPG
ncbi:MAG: hypothetical protein M3Z32_11845 [Acidobacteriota bacterium]|nr:hypothetical protein [Acidobacteriota bacterium]